MRFYIEGLSALGLAAIGVIAYTAGINDMLLFSSLPVSPGVLFSLNLRIKKVWFAMMTALVAATSSLWIHGNLELINYNGDHPYLFSVSIGLAITAIWLFLFSSFRLRPNKPYRNDQTGLKTKN